MTKTKTQPNTIEADRISDEIVRIMNRDLAGHHLNENQREAITKILLSLCVAIFALSRFESVDFLEFEIGLALIFVSFVGIVLSFKHSERSAFHLKRYKKSQMILHERLGFEEFEFFHEYENHLRWPLARAFSRLRLYIMWPSIFLCIGVFGALIIVV